MRILLASLLLVGSANAATPSQVIDLTREAMGGARWSEVAQIEYSGELQVAGMRGSIGEIVSTRDPRRVTHFDLSVIAGASGFDGVHVWNSDASGLVDIDDSEGGKQHAISTSYVANRLFLNPSAALVDATLRREDKFEVITFTPEGGEPIELWIDANTHLVARTALPRSRETAEWSDYRETDGLLLPYRLDSNDSSNNPQTVVIGEYRIGRQLTTERFAKPVSRANDTQVEAGSRKVPAYVEGGHVYVEASIDGSAPALFILDTGASANVLTPQAATKFGIESQGSLNATGVGESQVGASLATVSSVRIGPATLSKQMFAIIPLPPISLVRNGSEEPIAGLLGYDFFRRLRVTIDYAGQTVELMPLQACTAREQSSVPLYLDDSRVPRIPLTIAGQEALWTLDLGDAGSLTMSAALAQKLGIPTDAGVATIREGGVGGTTRSRLLQFDEIAIASHRLRDPIVNISEQKTGAFADPNFAGNIGYGTLRNFIPTFDYECRTLELARSTLFGTPPRFDGAGVTWRRGEDGLWRALHVMPGSPAAAAGLQAGDVLVSMNEHAASTLTRGKLGELQSAEPGSTLALTIERGEKQRDVQFTLARFIPRYER
jgi:predicted aspartyl protease